MITSASPLVSIVITTYNREHYLDAAIASVLAQTYHHFELLIWDDGSTDRSIEIAYNYAQHDQRVRVVAAPHQGRVLALKAAIAQTTGAYLGWVDSDDLLAPAALEETVSALNHHPEVGWVYTDYLNINADGQAIDYGHRCKIPYSPSRLLVDFMTFHFRLIRRSVFDQVGGIDECICDVEDYDLCLRLSESATVRHIKKPLYYYRNHIENSTAQNPQKRTRQLFWSKEAIARALKRRGLADQWQIDVQAGRFLLRRRVTQKQGLTVAKAGLLLAAVPVINAIGAQAQAAVIPPTGDVPISSDSSRGIAIQYETVLPRSPIQLDVHPEQIATVEASAVIQPATASIVEPAPIEPIASAIAAPASVEPIGSTAPIFNIEPAPNPVDAPSSEEQPYENATSVSTEVPIIPTETPVPTEAPVSNEPVLIAQAITPATDGTNTIVTPDGDRFDINGGQLSGDRTNLFHSFSQFGLSQNQIANFLADPQLRNILSRVVGGDPSIIDGQIQVTGGDPNLYLVNPAGIVFGPNASLDVGGSFTATTANGVRLGDRWFDVAGQNNYTELNGNPNAFAFTMSQPGTIINSGNLEVDAGQTLALMGGTVVNTGRIAASEGQIIVAAVPGERLVRISQPGQLLSLEIEPSALSNQLQDWTLPIATLPELLTGAAQDTTPDLTVDENGQARLTASDTPIPTASGIAVVSGQVAVSSEAPDDPDDVIVRAGVSEAVGRTGGTIAVLGDRVGIIDAQIDASGTNAGGTVLIGGGYQGQGTVFNASRTFVNRNSTINADALTEGDGGRVIVWADGATHFYGNVSVEGGEAGGNGGFVEISGADFLDYRGQVNASAPNGDRGTLLLDPTNIEIVGAGYGNAELSDGDAFTDADLPGGTRIEANDLDAADANIVLQAINDIIFNAPVFIGGGYDLTVQAGNNIAINADIDISSGDLSLTANDAASGSPTGTGTVFVNDDVRIDIFSGNFSSNSAAFNASPSSRIRTFFGGDLEITTTNGNLIAGDLSATFGGEGGGDAGNITLTSDTGRIETGSLSARGSNGGAIALTANDSIPVNNTIDSSGFDGNGGAVTLRSATGDITTQEIIASADSFDSDSFTTGGAVTMVADGDITTDDINTSAGVGSGYGDGNGGDIFMQAGGAIDTTAGQLVTGGFSGNDDSLGRSGNATLLAQGNITTGGISTYSSGSGDAGDISLTSSAGAIATTDFIDAGSSNGNGGAIRISANGNVRLADQLYSGSGSLAAPDPELGNGNGGEISVESTSGSVTVLDRLSSASVNGRGGRINLAAANTLTVNDVDATGVTGGDIQLSGRTVRFLGGVGSIASNGGNLLIQPATSSQNFTLNTINSSPFQDGFNSITIGRADGSGRLTIADAVTFSDPVLLRSPFGSLQIDGTLRGVDNGSIAIVGSGSTTTLNADIITVGTPITINDSVILGNNIVLDTTNDAAGANITITGTVNGTNTGNQGLTVRAGTGNVQFGNAIGEAIALRELQVLGAQRVDVAGNITTNGDIRFQGVGDRVNLTNSATFDAGTATVAFNNADLAIGSNSLTITANEVDFQSQLQITGTGNLLFQPATPGLNIALGGARDTGAGTLDLTQTDLSALQNGFASITIGRANSSGAIAVLNPITFADPVTLRTPAGAGSITANGATLTGIDDASIALLANQDIRTDDITAPAGITLTSRNGDIITRNLTTATATGNSGNITATSRNGSITTRSLNAQSSSGNGGRVALTARDTISTNAIDTRSRTRDGGAIALTSRTGSVLSGNLQSSGVQQGGEIRVEASDRIRAGQIDSSARVGNGGDVTLDPAGNISVDFINAQGGVDGIGGAVDITTARLFQATETFFDQNQTEASISAAGGRSGGSITIRHGGGGLQIPFDVGDVTTNGTAGALTVGENAIGTIAPFRSFPGTYIQGDIRILTQDSPIEPPQVELPPAIPDTPLAPPAATSTTPLRTLEDAREILQQIEQASGVRPALIYAQFVPAPTPAASWFNEREATFTQEFEEHLQGAEAPSGQPLTTARDTDELELLMVTAEGPPIARRLRGVTRSQVMQLANQFRREVTDVRKARTRSYLRPAQALYDVLIAPLETDLQTRNIQNLVFLPDVGLRSIPIAALHDGNGFLIQRYSVGLMPSLSLADTRYIDIRDSQVLAMGASEFSNQIPLPAVPVELSAIAERLWQGESFLNQNFTPENLRQQRQQEPFGIIHLATHAEFEPGAPNNSYIQFWDSQLRLDQLRQLGLNDPPVNLMVLSACRTALGNADAELGFAGLATQAGVKSVMASLWYVSDAGTLTLMTEFYDQLRTAPIKAEALRRAQLLMATGQVHLVNGQLQGLPSEESITLPPTFADLEDTDFSHPYYWSAFTMVGNPW